MLSIKRKKIYHADEACLQFFQHMRMLKIGHETITVPDHFFSCHTLISIETIFVFCVCGGGGGFVLVSQTTLMFFLRINNAQHTYRWTQKMKRNRYGPFTIVWKIWKGEENEWTLRNINKINKVILLLHKSDFLDRGCGKSIHPFVFIFVYVYV